MPVRLLYYVHMKKNIGTDRRLEAFKIFPYVAWGLTLSFALFVYNITQELRTITKDLQTQTQYIQEQIKKNPSEIENFDKPPFRNSTTT
jgi:hypothetical protein